MNSVAREGTAGAVTPSAAALQSLFEGQPFFPSTARRHESAAAPGC